MERIISSPYTWYDKFLRPPLMFGFLTPLLICGVLSDRLLSIRLIPILVLDVLEYWHVKGLMIVGIVQNYLTISNFKRNIRVPLTEIVKITYNRWSPHQVVWIHFRESTEFGAKIKFIPYLGRPSFLIQL